jgi:hypothetical protein
MGFSGIMVVVVVVVVVVVDFAAETKVEVNIFLNVDSTLVVVVVVVQRGDDVVDDNDDDGDDDDDDDDDDDESLGVIHSKQCLCTTLEVGHFLSSKSY